MPDTLSKLESAENSEEDNDKVSSDQPSVKPFKHFQEEAIVSLALDHSDFFAAISQFVKPEMFSRLEVKWVMAEVLNLFEK